MVSTCVWPRVNRPEPWTRGSRPTSAASGRISSMPRPSTRFCSSSSQRRTTYFCGLVEALVDLGLLVGVDLGKVLVHFFVNGLQALVADVLVVGVERGLDVLERVGAHGVLNISSLACIGSDT